MSHLTLEQRYKIEMLSQENYSQTDIAKLLGRNKSVICRELKRNSDGRNGVCKAELAQKKSRARHQDKNKIIYFTDDVELLVNSGPKEELSPEQIVGLAQKRGVNCVSHERIYQHIWKDKKASGVLYKSLRTQGKSYRKEEQPKTKEVKLQDGLRWRNTQK